MIGIGELILVVAFLIVVYLVSVWFVVMNSEEDDADE